MKEKYIGCKYPNTYLQSIAGTSMLRINSKVRHLSNKISMLNEKGMRNKKFYDIEKRYLVLQIKVARDNLLNNFD